MPNPFIIGLNSSIPEMQYQKTSDLYLKVGGNTGNLAFHAAIVSHFGGNLPSVTWGAPPKLIDSMGSVGIIPAANQLGAHTDFQNLADNFSQLSCNIVMIGLGAQSSIGGDAPAVNKAAVSWVGRLMKRPPEVGATIPVINNGTLSWIKSIAERSPNEAPNISVRGPFTKTVLDHYGLGGQAVVLGCPSLFLNPDPDLGKAIESKSRKFKRIAVAAGLSHWSNLRAIEQSLVRMVTDTGGSYVGQHVLSMIQLTRGEASYLELVELKQHRDYLCPEMSLDEFVFWTERHGNVFFDVANWMEHYRRFDFVIGARIHGTMLALQAGVPAICIVHDSRTLELCQTMMVPYVLAKDIANGVLRDQLPDLFAQFDAEAFDLNRQILAGRYVNFLEENGLSPVAWLKNISAGRNKDG